MINNYNPISGFTVLVSYNKRNKMHLDDEETPPTMDSLLRTNNFDSKSPIALLFH